MGEFQSRGDSKADRDGKGREVQTVPRTVWLHTSNNDCFKTFNLVFYLCTKFYWVIFQGFKFLLFIALYIASFAKWLIFHLKTMNTFKSLSLGQQCGNKEVKITNLQFPSDYLQLQVTDKYCEFFFEFQHNSIVWWWVTKNLSLKNLFVFTAKETKTSELSLFWPLRIHFLTTLTEVQVFDMPFFYKWIIVSMLPYFEF